jgi:multidrug efflux pump subunit AcrA (membrane-fusion protein)
LYLPHIATDVEEVIMSDRIAAASVAAAEAAHSTVEAYVATWNEIDAARRQAGIARTWAAAGRYRDPVMASDGPVEIDAMLAAVQARFPGFVLKRTSKVDSHVAAGERFVRFSWSLGPEAGPSAVEGVDFGTLAADGKLASIVGFIDKMPAV